MTIQTASRYLTFTLAQTGRDLAWTLEYHRRLLRAVIFTEWFTIAVFIFLIALVAWFNVIHSPVTLRPHTPDNQDFKHCQRIQSRGISAVWDDALGCLYQTPEEK